MTHPDHCLHDQGDSLYHLETCIWCWAVRSHMVGCADGFVHVNEGSTACDHDWKAVKSVSACLRCSTTYDLEPEMGRAGPREYLYG